MDPADQVQRLRHQRHLTRNALAKLAGVDNETVKSIEMGGSYQARSLEKIAQALGTTVAELMTSPVAPGDARKAQEALVPEGAERDNAATSAGPTPREITAVPLLQAIPLTSAHLTLYGLIGTLTVEEAIKLRRPLLDLVERTQKAVEKKPEKK